MRDPQLLECIVKVKELPPEVRFQSCIHLLQIALYLMEQSKQMEKTADALHPQSCMFVAHSALDS
jgi:hypothetical protein